LCPPAGTGVDGHHPGASVRGKVRGRNEERMHVLVHQDHVLAARELAACLRAFGNRLEDDPGAGAGRKKGRRSRFAADIELEAGELTVGRTHQEGGGGTGARIARADGEARARAIPGTILESELFAADLAAASLDDVGAGRPLGGGRGGKRDEEFSGQVAHGDSRSGQSSSRQRCTRPNMNVYSRSPFWADARLGNPIEPGNPSGSR